MQYIRLIVILSLSVVISACGDKGEGKRYEFIETISVSGTCREEHTNIKDKYNGFIARKYDNKEKREFIRGEVYLSNPKTVKEIDKKHIDMMKYGKLYPYEMPNEIELGYSSIPIETFKQEEFELNGVSRHYERYTEFNDKVVWRYDSICTLKVTDRKVF